MNKIKIICLVLAVLLILPAAVACTGNKVTSAVTITFRVPLTNGVDDDGEIIYQTDDAVNYKDMNALYRACKFAPKGDGTFTEADFEYRMLNGSGNDDERLLRAISTLVGNLKYK